MERRILKLYAFAKFVKDQHFCQVLESTVASNKKPVGKESEAEDDDQMDVEVDENINVVENRDSGDLTEGNNWREVFSRDKSFSF